MDHDKRPAAPLLRASGISKRFGKKRVLNDVSLEVAGGEVVAVVGENGSGKSTLLRICAGLVEPDAGEIAVDSRLGYCPQDAGLFELLTAEEHLSFFARAGTDSSRRTLGDARRLLRELGWRDEDRGVARELSGGARQKLNLALALVDAPRVLLLDEPYQGFDRGSYVNFWDHVARWRAGDRGTVIVTHLVADGAPVDRVVELQPA